MRPIVPEANFIDKILTKKRVIVRDDQISWVEAMDLAKWLSARKKALVVIDTGCFSISELEWLMTKKGIIVSSPEAGRSWPELLLLKRVAQRYKGLVIFGYNGSETGEKLAEIYFTLRHLGRGGVDLHISGQRRNLDWEALSQLAAECRRGHSWFVYYHYGPIETWLNQLAKETAWIHLCDRFFNWSQKNELEELFRSFPPRLIRLVVHIEDESRGIELIELVLKKGGFVIFSRPPWPFFLKKRYLQRPLLPFRAYHLEARALF